MIRTTILRRAMGPAAYAALVFVSAPAAADAAVDRKQFCTITTQFAESIMKARQQGMPVLKAVEIYVDNNQSQALRPLMNMMIQRAYAEPQWNDAQLQQRAVTDFGATAYVECMGNQP